MFVNKIYCRFPFRRTSQLVQYPQLVSSANQLIQRAQTMTSAALAAVPRVDIDPQGVFKYILLKVHDPKLKNDEQSILILRGYQRHNYHSDIYDEVQSKLAPLDCEPIGGGRISHEADNKKIHIYGYSQGYGKANHEDSAKMIKDFYPDYMITISDEGY